MNEKPLPLFESLASVFVVAVVALFAAMPALKKPNQPNDQAVILEDNLDQLRTAVGLYLNDHDSIPATAAEFEIALEASYLTALPENSINHRSSIRILNFGTLRANGTAEWIYVPADSSVHPDLPGEDGNGKAYLAY